MEHPEEVRAISHRNYLKYADEKRAYAKAYRQTHHEEVNSKKKSYQKEHREEISERRKAYYENHRDEILSCGKKRYADNNEVLKAKAQARRMEHPEKVKIINKKSNAKHPETRRAYSLRLLYGISLKEFDALLAKQGGGCAACGTSNWNSRGPVVDHDHSTGRVRGILCHNCNCGSGMLGDDPARVEKLLAYLRQ